MEHKQEHSIQQLAVAAYNTVLYCDVFEFAPTLLEVERWLLRADETHTDMPALVEIKHALEQHASIQQQEGFYYITETDDAEKGERLAALRKEKYIYSHEKYNRARTFLPLLAAMPHVEAISLANSVAWTNARKNSDIDLFIVTTPGRIWTARFFTTLWMRLFRQRPHETEHSKALCLSFYITADNLNLEPYKVADKDIYLDFWTTQVYPLYERGEYSNLTALNPWLHERFIQPTPVRPIPRRRYTQGTIARVFKKTLEVLPLEQVLKRFQLWIMPEALRNPGADSVVVIRDNILKLHTKDKRSDIQNKWQEGAQSPTAQ